MRFLLNASNLHVGGGIQVAASVIEELAGLRGESSHIHVQASSAVDANLRSAQARLGALGSYKVHNSHGISALWRDGAAWHRGYDAVFTLFGPLYSLTKPKRSVVGFAQAWILHPDNDAARMLPWLARTRMRAKFWLQSQFFRRADVLVAELEHVKTHLVRRGLMPADRIRVVHNTLGSVYANPSLWQGLDMPAIEPGVLRLGFVGRNFLHKNTALFPAICGQLLERHGVRARFFVTFTDEEWALCSPALKACAENVGPLSVAQCPAFYKGVDAVVFPSLLECFSATPLEAMAMECPLFASDRDFVRDVCAQHAHYFDPLDARSAADSIAAYFHAVTAPQVELSEARAHALAFSNASERARQYLACLYELAGADTPAKASEHV